MGGDGRTAHKDSSQHAVCVVGSSWTQLDSAVHKARLFCGYRVETGSVACKPPTGSPAPPPPLYHHHPRHPQRRRLLLLLPLQLLPPLLLLLLLHNSCEIVTTTTSATTRTARSAGHDVAIVHPSLSGLKTPKALSRVHRTGLKSIALQPRLM